MTRTVTNLLGIVLTILSGMYFFVRYCSYCNGSAAYNAADSEITGEFVDHSPYVIRPIGKGDTHIPYAGLLFPRALIENTGIRNSRDGHRRVIKLSGYRLD